MKFITSQAEEITNSILHVQARWRLSQQVRVHSNAHISIFSKGRQKGTENEYLYERMRFKCLQD